MSRIPGWNPPEPFSPSGNQYLPELAVASYRANLPEKDLQQIAQNALKSKIYHYL
jgi:hypothetical protein